MRRTKITAAVTAAAAIVAVLAWPPAAFAAPPANDDFDNATTISAAPPFTDTVSSADATTAPDDPTACNGAIGSVWYRFTPTRSGTYVASGTAEPYGAYLSIFTGTRGALTPIVCSSGTTAWPAEAGTTYYFMVSAFDWSPPGGDLTFTLEGPSMVDVTLDPRGQFDPRTGAARISGTVACLATGYTTIRGEVRQRVGRVIISGQLVVGALTCDGTTRPWVADVAGSNGTFGGGQATALVQAEGCADAVVCLSDVVEDTIRLTRSRPHLER
jgi:hypothetical protein